MARADLLKKLFQCFAVHDDDGFRQTADEIIAEESRSNHHVLAEDLRAILSRRNGDAVKSHMPTPMISLPRDSRDAASLVTIREPVATMEDVILDDGTRLRVDRVMDENRSRDRLAAFNLRPKQKLLFCGPPGCGKTLTAEATAHELGLPFALTRVDAVVSSYLGETSANLRRVFDFATANPCVLLLDEFDSIGKSRDDLHEVGELKRVVNSFLQMLDGFSGQGLVIAATNHQSLLDPALWRRFDEVIYFPKPTANEIVLLVKMLLRGVEKEAFEPSSLARSFKGFAHSEICDVVNGAIKKMVLSGGSVLHECDILEELKQYQHRLDVYRSFMDHANELPQGGKTNGRHAAAKIVADGQHFRTTRANGD